MVNIVNKKPKEKVTKKEKKMSIAEVFAGLMSDNDPSMQKEIVTELLSEVNLEQKTELEKPIRWSILTLIQDYLKNKNLVKSAGIIQFFTFTGMRYLISKNRQSRREYIDALNALNDMNDSGESTDKSA